MAGRKGELFPSLFDYEVLIPASHCCFWKRGYLTGRDDSVYVVGTPEQRSKNERPPDLGMFDVGVDMGPGNFTR